VASYLISFIDILFKVLIFAIFGRTLLSWVDPQGNMRITQILRDITEPILAPLRSVLPQIGMIDLSPWVAILLMQLLQSMIFRAIQ
jgi:YggT family protein